MTRHRMRNHGWRLAWALAALHFLLAGSFSVLNPLGESPDEADHWAYVVYIATQRALPQGPQVTQSKHPPGYHAPAAIFALVGTPDIAFLRANPDLSLEPAPTRSPNFFIHTARERFPWHGGALAFHAARLYTVLLSSATVLAAYGLTRAAFPARPGLALAVTGSLACWPEFAFLGGAVNNDTPVALWSTLALWGGFASARTPGDARARLRAGWWTPLALGLGLLTKLSAAAVWPIVGLTLVLGCAWPTLQPPASPWRHLREVWRARACWLRVTLGVFLPALVLTAPWFWRNWQLYADPLGVELARQTIDQRLTPWGWAETVWLVRGWFLSFWGKFGAVGHIAYPGWVYAVLALISLLSLLGLARVGWQTWHAARRDSPTTVSISDASISDASISWLPLALLAATAVAVAVGIWRYSLIALGTDQGRLLFPAIGPLLILLLVGLAAWIPHAWRARAGIALVAGLLLLTSYGLWGVLLPAYARPAPPPQAEIDELAMPPVTFGELTLVGHRVEPEPVLLWRADASPQSDWRTILRVVAEDGTLVWEHRRSPGYGRWSTDRWPPGTTLRDAYAIEWPEWAGPGTYLVEVGLYPFGSEPVIPRATDAPTPGTSGTSGTSDAPHPYHFLGRIQRGE